MHNGNVLTLISANVWWLLCMGAFHYLMLYLTLCGLTGESIIPWGWGLSGWVHKKAQPCLWYFISSLPLKALTLGPATISWSKLFQSPTAMCQKDQVTFGTRRVRYQTISVPKRTCLVPCDYFGTCPFQYQAISSSVPVPFRYQVQFGTRSVSVPNVE